MSSPSKPPFSFDWDRPLSGEVIDASPERMVAAIVPGRMVAGVHAPGYVKKDPSRTTYDWRKPAWSAENRAGIRALSEIGELSQLLLNPHTEFAHLVTYVIVRSADGAIEDSCVRTGSLWQPRVNKSSDAIGWLRSQGLDVWAVLVCLDMDTPGHVPWTPELKEKALATIAGSKLLLTCCWYWTTAGLRAVQPIFHIPVDKLEPLLHEWLDALKKEGFDVDFACVDWTRLMKMPKTFNPKTGERVDFEPQNLEGMRKIDLEALLDEIYGKDPADTRPRRDRVAVAEAPKQRQNQPRQKKPKKEKATQTEEEEMADPPDFDTDESDDDDSTSSGMDHDPDDGDPDDLDANGVINFNAPLSEIWKYRSKAIGREIFEVTQSGKLSPDGKRLEHHHLYRAIAGALRTQIVPGFPNGMPRVKRRFVPGIVRLIAQYAKEPASRIEEEFVRGARELILRKQAGGHVPGSRFLQQMWPTVNAVLEQETIQPNESVGYAWEGAGKMVEILSTEEAYKKLETAFRGAPDGVSGIGACAGLGKTKLIVDLALEHMRKKSINTTTGRSQRGGKSGATFDKHALAIQVRNDVIKLDADAKRLFGPASLKNDDGSYVCRYADQANAIAEGGNSVFRELCQGGSRNPGDRCPEWDHCQARKGFVGPEKGQFVLGPHAKKSDVCKEIGPSGRFTLDEPPPLLSSIAITVKDIQDAIRDSAGVFSERYRRALAPLLFALEILIPSVSTFLTGDSMDFADAVRKSVEAIQLNGEFEEAIAAHIRAAEQATKQAPSSTDLYKTILEYAKLAIHKNAKHNGPPIFKWKIPQLRSSTAFARRVGKAGRVYNTLRQATCTPFKVVARIDYNKIKDERVVNIILPDAEYIEVLRRTGPTILSDANLELHWDVLKAVVETPEIGEDQDGNQITINSGQLLKYKINDALAVHAFDGAEIRRVMLRDSHAVKKHWFSYGKPVWDAGILEAITAIINTARDHFVRGKPPKRPPVMCLITFKIIRLAIEYAIGKTASMSDIVWAERLKWIETQWLSLESANVTLDDLKKAKEKLEPVLTEWKIEGHAGTFILGHYGGVRGMNDAKDVDSIATLGDPWLNLGAVKTEASYLAVEVRLRAERHIAAELYQAQERLRSCRRRSEAIAIHYGNVRPGGPMWTGKRVEEISVRPVGRPKAEEAATGAWLVDLMESCNISGKELADSLGLRPSIVTRMRSGETVISEPDRVSIIESVTKIIDSRKQPKYPTVSDKIALTSSQTLEECIPPDLLLLV